MIEYITRTSFAILILSFLMYYRINLINDTNSENVENWKRKGIYFLYEKHPIFYIDSQEGNENLILLHGFPVSSYDYRHIFLELSKRYRVICLDLLGFGFSDKPNPHHYNYKEQTNIVEILLSRLFITNVHIIAHDYSVTVAQELLARFHENSTLINIESITFLNGGLFPESHNPLFIQQLLLNEYFGPIVSRLTNYYIFKYNILKTFGIYKPSEQDLIDMYSIISTSGGNYISHLLIQYIKERKMNRDRWVIPMKENQIPMIFICGPSDDISGKSIAFRLKQIIPQVKSVYLSQEVSHWPQLESPREFLKEFYKFQKSFKKIRSIADDPNYVNM